MKLELNTNTKRARVLILELGILGVKDYLEEREQEEFADCDFTFSPKLGPGVTLLTIYETCRDIVREQNIDVVVTCCDKSTQILAALTADFPHLLGPKYESFYMTADKVLTRELIIPKENNIPYFSLSMEHIENGIPIDEIVGEIGIPAFAKPANGSASALLLKISSIEDFKHLQTADFINSLNGVMAPMKDLIERCLDLEKYPSAILPRYIIESYVDQHLSGCTVHTVDALVNKGKMVPWAISDNLYWAHRPETFMGELMPSRLSDDMQNKAFKCMEAIVDNMRPYGFDNQFINAEVFCYPNGEVKVMEVNGRMCRMLKDLYANIIEYDGIFRVTIDVQQGKDGPTEQPKLKPNTCSFIAYLVTYGNGTAKDFLNYDNMHLYPTPSRDICLDMKVIESSPVTQVGDYGFNMGYANIVGTTFEDCLQKMEVVKADLLKHPELSPWFFQQS